MSNFTINNSITRRDYGWLMIKLTYRKPSQILMFVLGLFLLAISILGLLVKAPWLNQDALSWQPFLGLMLVLMPLLIWQHAIKTYSKTAMLNEAVDYHFSDEGIQWSGTGFSFQNDWQMIVKRKETKDFILLYNSPTTALFLNKEAFTPEQLNWVKSKVAKRK